METQTNLLGAPTTAKPPSRSVRVLAAITSCFALLAVFAVTPAVERILHVRVHHLRALVLLTVVWIGVCGVVLLAAAYRRNRAGVIVGVASMTIAIPLCEIALRVLHPAHAAPAFQFYYSSRFQ